MSLKARALLLGAIVTLIASCAATSTAWAEPGPYFHEREAGTKGVGEGASEESPVSVQGEGGEQILRGEIASTKVEIVAKSVQAKGIIFNNYLQGQVKTVLTYHEPRLVKPELKECSVKVGSNNELPTEGHLAWKWNGEKKQLEEATQKEQRPDLVFTPSPIEAGATKLGEGTFMEAVLSGSGCGVLAGKFALKGSLSVTSSIANVEEWASGFTITYPGWAKQHFWNEKENVGAEPSITLAGNHATLSGGIKLKTTGPEVAVFETGPKFQAETGWSGEGGPASIRLSKTTEISCEKVQFKGQTPTSGFSRRVAMSPTFGGCRLGKEGKFTKTTPESTGCITEFINPEEPLANGFKIEESKLVGCKAGGIVFKDTELEEGKTCEITIPNQNLGRKVEGKNTKEESPFGAQGKMEFANRTAEVSECPSGVPSGKQLVKEVLVIAGAIAFVALLMS